MKKRLTTSDAKRITYIANAMADRIIAGETLRFALPIARKILEIVQAQHKNITEKYGGV